VLRRSSYLALRDVSCVVSGRLVYLHGHLPTYYLKQVAQELAGAVGGVRRVINEIEILNNGSGDRLPPVGRDSDRGRIFAPVRLR
jgi:osmotically-inducible protein OsmY